jgi:CheY-like chemotaxis protein
LLQAQKLEAVARLAGGVAHDFNNMLAVIQGHAELALMRLGVDDPSFRHFSAIRDTARRSADLTQQLLAFARKQVITPISLDLNKTVESILKMLRRLLGEDIDLAWIPGKGLWTIKADPTQIDQILANLCINARDAITGVGKIIVATDNCSIDKDYCSTHAGFLPGDFVRISVSDNGCGMDKQLLNQIFEPFFTTKELGKGTGLGLATVYGAVRQNEGFVNVYSELGQGSVFSIYFPRYTGESKHIPAEGTVDAIVGGHETILLVEDELFILDTAKDMLEQLGYTVLAASTPNEAFQLAQQHPEKIDLVITDVIMPHMNGRDLANQLLAHQPWMKCLFMSGYTADIIAYQGKLEEHVHFIQKPFSLSILAAKIRQTLES